MIFIFNSFKTKGNLTKHMKSKAHFKKCSELGISPIPTVPDDDYDDSASDRNGQGSNNGRENDSRGDSETDENESDDDLDDDSGDDGKLKRFYQFRSNFNIKQFIQFQTLMSQKVECLNMKRRNYFYLFRIMQAQFCRVKHQIFSNKYHLQSIGKSLMITAWTSQEIGLFFQL